MTKLIFIRLYQKILYPNQTAKTWIKVTKCITPQEIRLRVKQTARKWKLTINLFCGQVWNKWTKTNLSLDNSSLMNLLICSFILWKMSQPIMVKRKIAKVIMQLTAADQEEGHLIRCAPGRWWWRSQEVLSVPISPRSGTMHNRSKVLIHHPAHWVQQVANLRHLRKMQMHKGQA